MDLNAIYKLAFAQDPTAAVASAAAAVGLPRCAVKLARSAVVRAVTKQIPRTARSVRQPISNTVASPIRRGIASPVHGDMDVEALMQLPKHLRPTRITPRRGTDVHQVTDDMIVKDFNKPRVGRRMLQNWWTIPVGFAGIYGLSRIPKSFSGIGDESPEMGYGYPATAQTPAQGRYAQMMALARQYGYM